MCIDPVRERLYVADACNHRIVWYDLDGRRGGEFGSLGSGAGQLSYPYDLALMSDGSLLVCEYGNKRLQRFSAAGEPMGTHGGGGRALGQLWHPWSVVVDERDRAYVVDYGNNRIQVWELR